MSVGFGPRRSVLPVPNLGVGGVAARKVAEAAGRAAERTRVAVAVDGYPSRVWLRYPRGSQPCPCSARLDALSDIEPPHGRLDGPIPGAQFEIVTDPAEFDDVPSESRGAGPADPTRRTQPRWSEALPSNGDDEGDTSLEDSDVMRLLLGNGRRCGICWGTGFVDGYQLWGGERIICCAVNTMGVEAIDDGLEVDDDFTTPTFVGPGSSTWKIDFPKTLALIDSVRVLNGISPALPEGVQLHFASNHDGPWFDPFNYFGELGASAVSPESRPSVVFCRLTLDEGAQASHVEIVARHHDFLPVQIPQIQQAMASEIIAPFVGSEFELDPKVGFIERGTLIEVPARPGLNGTLWVATDVQVKKTAQGLIFGVTGQCRNAQPTEVITAALLDGTAFIGSFFSGHPARGLEPTGASMPAGLPDGTSDDSVAAVKRGSAQRRGGGAISRTINLSTSFTRDEAREDELHGGFVDDWVYGDEMYRVEVNGYGQTEFELVTAFMTVNGVDYTTPDIKIEGTTVTWNGPFDLEEDDEVTVTLSTFLTVSVTPTQGQTSFLLSRPMHVVRRQFARIQINGVDYYPPAVECRTNELVWKGNFEIAPTDIVRLIYQPAPASGLLTWGEGEENALSWGGLPTHVVTWGD